LTDIVERLTAAANHPWNDHGPNEWLTEARDEIVRLRAERDRLRDVLILAESYSNSMGVLTVEAIRAALGDTP